MIYKVSLEYEFKGLNVKIIQCVKFLIIYQYLWLYVLLKDEKKKSLSTVQHKSYQKFCTETIYLANKQSQ